MSRQITVFDPFRLLRDDFSSSFGSMISDDLTLDLSEDDDNVYVEANIPGFPKDKININIEDQILTISGQVDEEKEEKDDKRKYHRRERSFRSFSRSVALPTRVQTDEIKAKFTDGVLGIEMPKAPEVRPQKIEISVD